jgi:hypothetical protein
MSVMVSMTAGFWSVVRFVLEDWPKQTHPESLFSREVVCLGRREAEQVTKFRKIVIILDEKPCTTYNSHNIHTLDSTHTTQQAHSLYN